MKFRHLLIGLAATLSVHAHAQSGCSATVTATPTRTIFGNPVTLTATVQNAAGAAFYRIIQANGASLTATSIPISPPIGVGGSATLTLTIPSATSVPVVPPLTTNNEQPQSLTLQLFGNNSPDPMPCTVVPATVTMRKLPTATIISRDAANPPTFTAQVYSSQPIPATGTVSFKSNGRVLGTGPRPLSQTETDLNTRTATYTPDSTVGVGTINVTAEFDGDANLLKSKSEESTFSVAPDTSPDDFQFTDANNAALGAPIESGSVTITGINAATPISVTGGSYSISGAPFTADSGTVTNGQTIRLQHVVSCSPGTAVVTSVTVGNTTRTFTSRSAGTGGVGNADTDLDGVPDAIECANGMSITVKDNNIFGQDGASLTRYIQQVYRDFLGREADSGGLSFWNGRITRGEASRFDLLSNFIFSAEYQNSIKPTALAFIDANTLTRTNENAAVFVYAAYRSLLGRNPDAAGYNFWYGQLTTGGQPLTAVLAEFYYSTEYVNRFLATGQPARCVGTVGFVQASAEARNAVGGQLAINLTRSSNVGACSVELVLCTNAACGTTATGANYAPTGYAGDPLRQLINFAAGQTTATAGLTITNPTATTVSEVRMSLQNPSWGGMAIGGNTTLNVTFQTASSGCEFGAKIDGTCMPPALTRSQTPGRRNCFSEGNGPCLSWQVAKPAACPADVRTVWQYNTNLPQQFLNGAGETIDYGPTKGFAMRANEVITFRFKTPATTGLIGGVSALDDAEGNESVKFVSLSETQCDFASARAVAGDACYNAEAGNLGAGLAFSVANTPVAGRCTLKPNTVYYLNVRSENARNAPGVDDCASKPLGTCGYILNFNGIQQ